MRGIVHFPLLAFVLHLTHWHNDYCCVCMSHSAHCTHNKHQWFSPISRHLMLFATQFSVSFMEAIMHAIQFTTKQESSCSIQSPSPPDVVLINLSFTHYSCMATAGNGFEFFIFLFPNEKLKTEAFIWTSYTNDGVTNKLHRFCICCDEAIKMQDFPFPSDQFHTTSYLHYRHRTNVPLSVFFLVPIYKMNWNAVQCFLCRIFKHFYL